MTITYDQIAIYSIAIAIILSIIYIIIGVYVTKHNGDKKIFLTQIPGFLTLYFALFVAGPFFFFGLNMAYSIAFENTKVEGATESFGILFGLCFAYFPLTIIIVLLKQIIYFSLSTCIQTYK